MKKTSKTLSPVARSRETTRVSPAELACERITKLSFSPTELLYLVEVILPSQDRGDVIRSLFGDNVQAFVDVLYEALVVLELSLSVRKKCIKTLYTTCGDCALIPSAMRISARYDPADPPLFRGGFGDVWKGEHCGQEVAIKVIKTYSNSELKKVMGSFCKEVVTWKALRHPNVVPLIGVNMASNYFAMISNWMSNGNINDFLKENPDADRLGLLMDVTRGLIYIHSQEMIHGDLKGLNILIDETCHARLADFGLLTIVASTSYTSTISAHGGTVRWMSPELIEPKEFGFNTSRCTKESDCYALGIVTYEVISGNLPFCSQRKDINVALEVLKGNRPSRDGEFADPLWDMLKLCWMPHPNDRPKVEDVLRCLEGVSRLQKLPSPLVDKTATVPEEDADSWGSTNESPGIYPSAQGASGPPCDVQAAGGQTETTPVALPPQRKLRPATTRRPEKCSICGVIGHRSRSGRCSKSALRVVGRLSVLPYIKPHSNIFDSRKRHLKEGQIRGSGD